MVVVSMDRMLQWSVEVVLIGAGDVLACIGIDPIFTFMESLLCQQKVDMSTIGLDFTSMSSIVCGLSLS